MKKLILLCSLVIIFLAAWFFIKKYVGDIRPMLFPSRTNLANVINDSANKPLDVKTGEPLGFPLHLPEGYKLGVYATGVPGARDLQFSPAGTLLVSETDQGKVVALPDVNKDGQADDVVEVINNLNHPHGLAFDTEPDKLDNLYIAEETKLSRYTWDENTKNVVLDKTIATLPSGGRHYTRSIVIDPQGKIYVSIGSTCDTCFEKNSFNGAVIVTDRNGSAPRLYAKGLRNAVFLALNPKTNQVWGTEMGRDYLGDDSPPDEINILTDGGDYGWPVCYGDKTYDQTFDQKDPSYCDHTIAPIYNIPAHSAPLGLVFIDSKQFPADWQGDLLVAYHGSWNRSTPTGYKIVHMKVHDNQILEVSDFITGFLQGSTALGRPVDMTFDQSGSLYISDDKAGAIYKVVKQ